MKNSNQNNNTSTNDIFYVVIFVVAFLGFIASFYFYKKATQLEATLHLTRDSLYQVDPQYFFSKKDTLPEAPAEILDVDNPNMEYFIEQLFSAKKEETRKLAQNILIQKFGEEPELVFEILNYALDEKMNGDFSSALWRTTYLLTRIPKEHLAANQSLVEDFFREMFEQELVGKKTQSYMDSVVEKIITVEF